MKLRLCTTCVALALLTSSYSSALPPKDKDRVHEQKLSNAEHELDGEHNPDYDHDAFLGHEEAEKFEDLSPQESKDRLALIVDKIDKDRDGLVTEEELQQWIQYVQKKYVGEDTDRTWRDHDHEDGTLTWESYRKRTYGYEHEPEEEEDYHDMVKRDMRKFQSADENKDGKLSKDEFAAFLHPEEYDHMKDIVVLVTIGDESEEYHNMLRRDERKFNHANLDRDGKLSLEEFTAFRHPEEFPHMQEVVVLETIEDIDKDKDGFISVEEYIADLEDEEDDEEDDEDDTESLADWKASEREQFRSFRDRNRDGKLDQDEVRHWVMPDDYDNGDMWPNKEEEEPDWVKNERNQFSTFRDQNGDGRMDSAEVKTWIIPPNYDHSEAEAKHLIYESDSDKDGKLSKDEILESYDIFVGSQATDFGEALTRHDEF